MTPRGISTAERVRVAVRLVSLLGWLLFCLIAYHLWKLAPRRNPWPRIFLRGTAWIAGAEVAITGHKPVGGAFLLANHVSWLDVPVIAGMTGSAFVAHSGLARNPLMRWLCAMNDTVFVARHDRGAVADQVEQVRQSIRQTGALTIFPEGTTSDGVDLLPFKSSLLSALAPLPEGISVQPVLLDYGAEAAEIAWVGEQSGIDNFVQVLARSRPLRLTVHMLPPLQGEDLAHRKAVAAAARAAIEAALRRARHGV